MNKPRVDIIGKDGNTFAIIGRCKMSAGKFGWTPDEWEKVQCDMMSDDYNHLLEVIQKYFRINNK